MKKRILMFYGILFLICAVLMIVQIGKFGGFTGFVIEKNVQGFEDSYGREFAIKIVDYAVIGDSFNLKYHLMNYEASSDSIKIRYSLLDDRGNEVVAGKTEIVIEGISTGDYILKFEVPKNTYGDFKLKLDIYSRNDLLKISRDIFLSDETITGLAISESNKRSLSAILIVILGFIGLFALFRFLNGYKKSSKHEKKEMRELIKIDFS